MAIRSILVLGLLGLAGLSLSASLVIVDATPGVGDTGESERQGQPRIPVDAHDDTVPVYDLPDRMPAIVHGSWEALFWARGG